MTFNVGLYGLGRFGKFLAKYLKEYGFNVIATDKDQKINDITFLEENEFIKNEYDIVIFCNSINSFDEVTSSA